MNIQTVATNLRVTITGKEELLADLKGRRIPPEVSIHYLEINIDELKRILQDVEQCIPKSEYSLDGPMIKMFRED
jgi:hypothetical protein